MKMKDRRTVKLYLEAADLVRLTARAREERKLVAEWVRSLVLDELNASEEFEEVPEKEVKPRSKVAEATVAHNLATGTAVKENKQGKRICPHGNSEGHYCLSCEAVI